MGPVQTRAGKIMIRAMLVCSLFAADALWLLRLEDL
jgi:hypothetical protein